MKKRKLFILSILALTLSVSACNIKLYNPNEERIVQNSLDENTPINVINSSNYQGTITYASDNQQKLSKEAVYENGLASTVYIIATNLNNSYLGSGVFFSEDTNEDGNAYLFTNAHVIKDATHIEIVYSNYKREVANLVGYNLLDDVAVLSVKKNDNYKIPTIQTTDKLKVSSEVVTIGTPVDMQYSFVATSGVISKIDSPNTSAFDSSYELLLLQIDATLNSGNSGGPLFDMYGNLIGLNQMKILYDTSYNSVDNFNFAIPSERALFIANRIFTNKPYQRGLIGITIADIVDMSISQRTLNHISLDYGLYVDSVLTGGASEGILQSGDIVTKINNKPFTTKNGFKKELFKYGKGDEITLTIYRGQEYKDFTITLK